MNKVHTLVLLSKRQETPHVQTFCCQKPTGFAYTAGQYFFLSLTIDGKLVRKPLSFSSAPHEEQLCFTKRISTSDFSQGLASLKPGDTVTLEGPLGNFTLPEKPTHIVFIAGGIGITPFRSMLLENSRTKKHKITVLYGNTTETEIVFRNELAPFDVRQQIGGTITADFIKEKVPGYTDKLFYICGSPAMVTALCAILQNELCIPNTHIKVERLAGY